MKSIALSAFFILSAARAAANCFGPCNPEGDSDCFSKLCWHRFYFETAFGKTIGVNEGYSSFLYSGLVPVNDILILGDARWYHLNNGDNAASAGIGFRAGDESFSFGYHIFADWRHSHRKEIVQVGNVLEFFFCSWKLSLYGAFPLEQRSTFRTKTCTYEGGFFFSRKEFDLPCRQVYLELAKDITCPNQCYQFTGAAGPYYITNKQHKHKIGGKLNLQLVIREIFLAQLLVSVDPIFNTRAQMILGLVIPIFCPVKSNGGWRPAPVCRPVDRQGIIPLDRGCCCEFNWDG